MRQGNKINNISAIQIYEPGKPVYYPFDSRVVLVGGCFDILHYGHMQFLEKAKATGDYLIVALEPDQNIETYKNRAPLHNQLERAKNLAALRHVDQILLLPNLNGFDEYNQLTLDVNPDIIAITAGDAQIKNKQIQACNVKAQLIIVVDHVKDLSSTKIHKMRLLNQEEPDTSNTETYNNNS